MPAKINEVAMEIVKRGQLPGDEEAEWDCKTCHSTIRAKKFEGKYHGDQREGDSIIFLCPFCGDINYITVAKFK